MLIELAWKEMLADKKFQGLTENSLRSYDSLWGTFSKFLAEEGIERTDELNPRVFKKYLMWCEERGNNNVTINAKLKLLRAFARWLHEEGITDDYTCKNVKSLKVDDNPRIVRDEDIKKALSYLRRMKRREDSFYAMRNHTILIFLIGTGLRANELCSLDWDDIDFKDQLITLKKTKSRKLSSVPMSETVTRELTAWRMYVERHFEKVPEPVFCTREGNRITRNGIRLMFQRIREKAGIEGTFCAHAMRNVFIKNLLKNKANLREAQLLARHSKIEVTKQYVGYFQHELKEAIDEHDPLRGLL
jgi:integrase/recombinase XerD